MKNLISHILTNTKMSQKDLAAAIGVSGAQISKWKSGEPIPFGRKGELMEIAQIPSNFEVLELAGTEENIDQWIHHLRADVVPCLEHGLDDAFEDRDVAEENLLELLEIFQAFGLVKPYTAPQLIEHENGDISFTQEAFHNIAYETLVNLSDIRFWINSFVSFSGYSRELGEDYELTDLEGQIQDESFQIAAMHIDIKNIPTISADAFESLKRQARNNMAGLIQQYLLRLKLGSNRTPLVDLYDLVNISPNQLAIDAETFDGASYITMGDRYADLTYKNTMGMLNNLYSKIDKLETKIDQMNETITNIQEVSK